MLDFRKIILETSFFPLKKKFQRICSVWVGASFGFAFESMWLLCQFMAAFACLAYTAATDFHIVSVEYFVEFVGSPKVFVDIKV